MVNEKLTGASYLRVARTALPGLGTARCPPTQGKMMPYEMKMPHQAPYTPDAHRLRRRELFAGLLVYAALLAVAFSL